MNRALVLSLITFVLPCALAALVACVTAATLRRKGKTGFGWLALAGLGAGCFAGNAWAQKDLVPHGSATEWLGVMAVIATAAAFVRGDEPRARVWWVPVQSVALVVIGWLAVRTLPEWKDGSVIARAAPLGALWLWGGVATMGLERAAALAKGRGGWTSAAVGWVMAFSISQVIVIGHSVQNAAWMAAGVAAVFGVALVVGLIWKVPLAGPMVMAAAGVLLSGLLFFGYMHGECSTGAKVLYGGLLLLGALGPALAQAALGERGRGWPGVVACAVPALGAVVAAAIITPPPFE